MQELQENDLEKDTETHGVETAFHDRSAVTDHTEDNQQLQHANEILNEYDVFSPGDLEKLAQDKSIEGRAKLLEVAEKYDIPMTDGMTADSIIDKIINAMNSQDAPNWFLGTE